MALTKARLNRWDQIVGLEVRHELVSVDLFDDLGDERDIGNRSEVAWVSWIKSRTFDDGDQNRSFLVQRHDSFYDGSIANCGEEWQQNVQVLLRQERRQGVEFARLRSSGNDDATQFSRGDSRHSRLVPWIPTLEYWKDFLFLIFHRVTNRNREGYAP